MASTLIQKIWDSHVISSDPSAEDLLYIDLHLIHEVSSPQAFDGLRAAGRTVRRPDLTLGTEDHNTPTGAPSRPNGAPVPEQMALMRNNCDEFGIPLHPVGHPGQGIVHVIGPELGLTRPGMTVVCGDSHTSTHGAFGALAFGIGATQVEHVLATQTLRVPRRRDVAVTVTGRLDDAVTAKDLALKFISVVGSAGARGCFLEYRGPAVSALSMEGRMTLCNMSIEAGATAGVIAPDETTFRYLRERPGMTRDADWERDLRYWQTLYSDEGASFGSEIVLDGTSVRPFVTWGTNCGHSVALGEAIPDPADCTDSEERASAERALTYMGLEPGDDVRDLPIDVVFVGSCTNGRIEDLRAVAEVLRGRVVAASLRMLIVAGSAAVRRRACEEGLDRVFAAAGADFRVGSGCSMCCGLNDDRLAPGTRAVSTSNRNFEGRQGKGSRTHLVSPPVAAATAVTGRICAPADL